VIEGLLRKDPAARLDVVGAEQMLRRPYRADPAIGT
jgi:hypothetical protein